MARFADKKDIEHAQLDAFRGLYLSFPDGYVVSSEEPDFLIYCDDCVVGLELTELYWKTPSGRLPRQSQENMRFKICRLAQTNWNGAGLPAVYVAVSFSPHKELKRKDRDRLASAIVAIAQRILPEHEGRSEEGYEWDNRDYFPEELDTVSVYRSDALTEAFFGAPDAAYIPHLQQEDLIRALSSKEIKYLMYCERVTEVWLLININCGSPSMMFEVPKETIEAAYQSPYQRAFVLSHSARKLWQLKLAPLPTRDLS